MSKSLKQFNRWKTEMKSTWAFQVFNKYNDELNNMIWADKAARLFVYKILGNNKAKYQDRAIQCQTDFCTVEFQNGFFQADGDIPVVRSGSVHRLTA